MFKNWTLKVKGVGKFWTQMARILDVDGGSLENRQFSWTSFVYRPYQDPKFRRKFQAILETAFWERVICTPPPF